jgi:hypothetical protein
MDKTYTLKKNSFLILLFFAFMFSHNSYASSALTITEDGDVEIGGRGTCNTLKVNAEVVVPVPLGTIIDWWRPDATHNIPLHFLMCDGRTVNDPASPYNGKKLPDLRNKFTRGVNQLTDIGQLGGENRRSYEGVVNEGGSHHHNFDAHGNRTFPISNGGGHPGRQGYRVQDEDRWDGDLWGHIMVNRSYYSERSGNHRHDLPQTDAAGTHEHSFGITMDTVPSYVGLLKIIRIK